MTSKWCEVNANGKPEDVAVLHNCNNKNVAERRFFKLCCQFFPEFSPRGRNGIRPEVTVSLASATRTTSTESIEVALLS